jgi:hypothetical protein
MKTFAKVIALSVLGASALLSVGCENMDAGAVSNALGTISNNVSNSHVSSALDTTSSVIDSTQPNNDQ